MEPYNPYAPPVAASGSPGVIGHGGFRLEGNTLVVDKGATLPNLCLYDGSPVAGPPTQKTLTWVTPWVTVLVVLSPLIYLIAFLIAKKTGAVGYYLGDEARKRRKSGIVLMVLSVATMFVAFIAAVAAEEPSLIFLGIFAFLVLLIIGAVRMRIYTIQRIDEHAIWLRLQPDAARAFASRLG